MKKIILILVLAMAGTSFSATINHSSTVMLVDQDWKQSKDGHWMGKDKVWHKLNQKDASVWWSKDGKKWEEVKDGTWQDKEGKWLKISEGKLVWSKDGKSWADVPEWTWEGVDGTWNKFDKQWNLWTKKG